MSGFPDVEQSYSAELIRKAIHLCSLSIPVIYYFISKEQALAILVPLTIVFGISDLARVYHRPTRRLYHTLFGGLLRKHERDDQSRQLNGATFVLLSACLFVWLYPKLVFITAFAILIVSDTAGALVGRKVGRHPFLSKSLEGTSAFFISALVVIALAPKAEGIAAEYVIAAVAALAGALTEAYFTFLDDNLLIPASVGGVLWVLYETVLPTVNVYALDTLR